MALFEGGRAPTICSGGPLIKQPPVWGLQPKTRMTVYRCSGGGAHPKKTRGQRRPLSCEHRGLSIGSGSDLGQRRVGKSVQTVGQPDGIFSPPLSREGGWREANCRHQWTRSGCPRGPVGNAGSCWLGLHVLFCLVFVRGIETPPRRPTFRGISCSSWGCDGSAGGGGEHFSLSLPLCPWARESRCLRGCHCPSWASTLWQGSLGLGLLRGPRAAAAQPPTRRPPCRQSSGTKCPPAREAEAGPDQWPAHFSTKGQRVHIFNLLGSRQLCRRGRAAPTPGRQCRPARSCANKTSLTRSGSGLLLAWSAHPRLQAQNPAGDGERTAEVG